MLNSNIGEKYKSAQTEISFQLKEIREKLKNHSLKAKGSNDYGYLGDVLHIKEQFRAHK